MLEQNNGFSRRQFVTSAGVAAVGSSVVSSLVNRNDASGGIIIGGKLVRRNRILCRLNGLHNDNVVVK